MIGRTAGTRLVVAAAVLAAAGMMLDLACRSVATSPSHIEYSSSTERGIMPEQTVDITVVCDNYEHTAGLETTWGFACVVKAPDKTILFDTSGDGDILLGNLAKLDIAPADTDVVVLSHDHWDHTGGLSAFLSRNAQVTVYVLRAFSNTTKAIAADTSAGIVEVTDPVEICAGVRSRRSQGYRGLRDRRYGGGVSVYWSLAGIRIPCGRRRVWVSL